jgi:P4 family phage/plasmid primase-like protien
LDNSIITRSADTDKFFYALYGNLEIGNHLYLWTKQGEAKETISFSVDDLKGMASAAYAMQDERDVYFGIGGLNREFGNSERLKNNSALFTPALVMDLDVLGLAHKQANLPSTIEEALSIIPDFLQPSIVVWSGHGLHAYWLLKEIWFFDTQEENLRASNLSVRLQAYIKSFAQEKGWKFDSTADLARVLRVPGTLNHKIPEQKQPVYITQFNPEIRYDPSELEDLIPDIDFRAEITNHGEFERRDTDASSELMIYNCQFLQYCLHHAPSITYGEWLSMLTNVVRGTDGIDKCHELSRGDTGRYTVKGTDFRISEALKMNPHTCDYIKTTHGFACPAQGCGVKSPCSFSLGKVDQARAKVNILGVPNAEKVFAPDMLEALSIIKRKDAALFARTKDKFKGIINLIDLEHAIKQYSQEIVLSGPVPKSFPYTELGNAERLIYHHGADLRYCHPWNKWLVWDERRWFTDTTGEINRRAFATVRQMLAEASKIDDEAERKALVKWEQKSESGKVRREMIETSKSLNGIPVLPDDLDKHPWTLNVNNGEIDLRTGKLEGHKRENLITKLAPVTYDPNAKCPTWESFLCRIMNGNTSLIGFLQRAIGYALTGDTGEQCLFILYGAGANGKSVFLDTVSALFGEDYAQNTPASTLMVRRNEGIPNDIAALKGARLITAIEAEEGQRLAESLVKSMTGGDKMTARFMRGEFFSFIPEFKLFLATNHKPQIKGVDHAIWRRINLIPFEVTIPAGERDRSLSSKLKKELSGILNWALEGCLWWQREGLGIPDEVKAATNFYRDEMDVIGDFLADRCMITPVARVENKDLRMAYERWCDANGERAISQKAFSSRLVDRGFVSSRSGANGRRAWPGIGLVYEENNPFTDGF